MFFAALGGGYLLAIVAGLTIKWTVTHRNPLPQVPATKTGGYANRKAHGDRFFCPERRSAANDLGTPGNVSCRVKMA